MHIYVLKVISESCRHYYIVPWALVHKDNHKITCMGVKVTCFPHLLPISPITRTHAPCRLSYSCVTSLHDQGDRTCHWMPLSGCPKTRLHNTTTPTQCQWLRLVQCYSLSGHARGVYRGNVSGLHFRVCYPDPPCLPVANYTSMHRPRSRVWHCS